MKKHFWNILLFLLIPIGELKAVFYHLDTKVDWYLFSDNARFLCNVMEDYGNVLTFIVLFAYILYAPRTPFGTGVCRFMLIISILDLLHLGAYDMQGLMLVKFALAAMIWLGWYFKNKNGIWPRR